VKERKRRITPGNIRDILDKLESIPPLEPVEVTPALTTPSEPPAVESGQTWVADPELYQDWAWGSTEKRLPPSWVDDLALWLYEVWIKLKPSREQLKNTALGTFFVLATIFVLHQTQEKVSSSTPPTPPKATLNFPIPDFSQPSPEKIIHQEPASTSIETVLDEGSLDWSLLKNQTVIKTIPASSQKTPLESLSQKICFSSFKNYQLGKAALNQLQLENPGLALNAVHRTDVKMTISANVWQNLYKASNCAIFFVNKK
jgi:hypothetical protein